MSDLFQFEDPEVKAAWDDLFYKLDETEPCYDPLLVDTPGPMRGDSVTDLYVEGWANGNASKKQAEALCEPCHVKHECKVYAMLAKEPTGIWGGTRPRDRGIDTSKKRRK